MTDKQLNTILDRIISYEDAGGSLSQSWRGVETMLRDQLNRPDQGEG